MANEIGRVETSTSTANVLVDTFVCDAIDVPVFVREFCDKWLGCRAPHAPGYDSHPFNKLARKLVALCEAWPDEVLEVAACAYQARRPGVPASLTVQGTLWWGGDTVVAWYANDDVPEPRVFVQVVE